MASSVACPTSRWRHKPAGRMASPYEAGYFAGLLERNVLSAMRTRATLAMASSRLLTAWAPNKPMHEVRNARA